MIIGVDGNEANVEERVGVSWYVFNIINEFYRRATPDLQFDIFLKNPPLSHFPSEKPFFRYRVVKGKRLWSQIFLPLHLLLYLGRLSVFLSPAHYAPRLFFGKQVVIVHDLSYFYYPQDFLKKDLYQLINWTRYSVKKAHAVVAVSEATKQDIIARYRIKPDKITVIHNGFSKETHAFVGSKTIDVKEPYFLYIGTLQPRKNVEGLLFAFKRFTAKYPQHHLYIVGKKGWLYENFFSLINKLQLTEKVIFTGYVTEDVKWWLLKHAQALIMPGFYEGFGLPVLEGFWAQTPVLCANSGALPEVGGEAVLYFDPNDPYSMFKAMEQSIQLTAAEKEALFKKARDRLAQFSWLKTTAAIIEVCKKHPV